MTKKSFLSIAMVFLGLLAGTNTAWAEDAKIYVTSLKAQTAPVSTGSGDVKLTWLDITGKQMEADLAKALNNLALESNVTSTDASSTAQLVAGALFAMDGIEVPMSVGDQIYMTSYTYFHAEVQPANGSYFAEWTFSDPAISRIDTVMGCDAVLDEYDNVIKPAVEKRTPCFKVLPDTVNNGLIDTNTGTPNAALSTALSNVVNHPRNIYAVFKKYLLSNPQTMNGQLDAAEGETTELYMAVDVEGDIAQLKENFADFYFPSPAGEPFAKDGYGEWSWELDGDPEILSATKMRLYFIVHFTAKSAIVPDTYQTTFTVRMEGENPSTLNIPLTVNALDPYRKEATWLDGKEVKNSGDLSNMLAYDISGYANPVLKLNKQVTTDLTFAGKNFTLDLNGNSTQAITISSGNVTIAYSKYGGEATSLKVNGGKAILNGGTFGTLTIGTDGTVEQNGADIYETTNEGRLVVTDGHFYGEVASRGSLIVNGGVFEGATAITIEDGTAAINRGAIGLCREGDKGGMEGSEVGLLVSGGEVTVKKLATITGVSYSVQRTGGTLTIECGKFGAPLDGEDIAFNSGYFKTNDNYGVSTEGKNEMLVSVGVEYNEGYRYFLGTAEAAVANGAGVCRIGNVSYATLEEALAYANNKPSEEVVIFMTNNYTLPAGYYTLPAKATLVVPMSDTQAKEVNMNAPRVSFHDADRSHPYVEPTEFRRLTFANGVKIDVFGDIELTGTQFSSNEAYTSQPYGPYGRLVMEEGSHMTLQSGSELRAWGFMTGKGETDARRGSKVREMFQMGDWKGAFTSVKITGMMPSLGDDSDKKIFPVTQYFIQNIESPVKYHPGAVLSTSASVAEGLSGFLAVSMTAADIKIVGVSGTDQAIFLMDIAADADNTWVRKWYDASKDQQVYEVNSGAHIGSMVLDMGELSYADLKLPVRLNSAKFDLPITSNFKIHLLSGTMDFKQNTSLLPGAEVEVDKESTVSVAKDNNDPEHTGALYVYDAAQWNKYAYCNVAVQNGDNWTSQTGTAYTKVVRYAPSWNGRPTKRDEQTCPESAAINVKGTFKTDKGYVYTSEGGANIFSNNADAGTFIFNQSAESAGTREVNQVLESGTYESRFFYSAKLKNGIADPAYAETTTAQAEDAYCYMGDKWTTMINEDCFVKDNYGVYYAKPSEYVALANGTTANDDHTYSDKAGTGRLFILAQGEQGTECQWWEVEKRDNLYYCAKSDMYYVYDNDLATWTEKRFTITWKNWDGTIVQTANADGNLQDYDIVKYGTMAEFLGTNPTREASADYTYDFVGWTPELGPVKSDVTYTATYKPKQRKYTIIFQQEGESEIERQFLPREAVPVCKNTPTKVGHILQWKPSIAAVTGDQTYTATWLEELPDTWDIIFSNYDGTPLLELTKEEGAAVTAGTSPEYTGDTPTKDDPLSEYNFTFAGWKGLDGTVYVPGQTLPVATENATYVAQFTPEMKKYTISYFKEDGITPNPTKASEELPYGATPTPPAVSPESPQEGYSYTLVWKTNTGDPAIPIQIVTGSASYKPTYEAVKNKYTVTLTSNIAGACTFNGAGIYDHGTKITIKAIPAEGYEFVQWNETSETNANLGEQTITEDITLTAIVKVAEPVAEDLEIAADGEVTLGSPKTYPNLIITSNGFTSGQLHDPENLTVTGNAYFDLEMAMSARTWYAVAVPWKVDAASGIIVNGSPLRLVTDIDVLYYDGASRADNGTGAGISNWKYVADLDDKTLNPGTLYMIYLANPTSSIRFKKKAGADISTTELSVQQHTSKTGSDIDAGWNGIANPALYHAFINAGASTVIPGEGATQHPHYAQKYVPGADSYVSFVMETNPLIVGAPIFVQVATSNTISAYETKSGAGYAQAPRRAPRVDNAYYEVQISAGEAYTDRLYLQTLEDKEDRYVIGLDLAKAGVSNKVAQMWVSRYNAKLCVNTTAPVGKTATYPLGISIPENGTYQISSATEMQANQELYVTRNGKAIWNLAYGPYTVTLDKGTYSEYGIKLIQSNAPAVTTGVDQTTNDKQQIQKVVIDNHVYIVREGELYTITGQKVK